MRVVPVEHRLEVGVSPAAKLSNKLSKSICKTKMGARRFIKPHFNSLEHFCKYKKWWLKKQEMFGPERDDLTSRLRRHERSNLRSHLSSHLSSDLNFQIWLNQAAHSSHKMRATEHQLDISDR